MGGEPSIQVEIVASDTNQNRLRRDADIAIRMADPTQNALIARRLGDMPLGLFATRDYFDWCGRITSKDDLRNHDLIGLDRDDVLIRGFAAHGIRLNREDFALRTDDGILTCTCCSLVPESASGRFFWPDVSKTLSRSRPGTLWVPCLCGC